MPSLLGTIAVFVVACQAAFGGFIDLTWNPSEGATGYRLYHGSEPGVYGAPVDVGNVTVYRFETAPDCATTYYAVTAYNAAGESGYSNEVFGWPSPEIIAATPVDLDRGAQIGVVYDGRNFPDGAYLVVDEPGLQVVDLPVVTCTSFTWTVQVDGGLVLDTYPVAVVEPQYDRDAWQTHAVVAPAGESHPFDLRRTDSRAP